MKPLPNYVIKLLLISGLIIVTELLQTKLLQTQPKSKFKTCQTDIDCRGNAVGSEICDKLPSGEGVCVMPGEEFNKNVGKACRLDDDCPSTLLCENGQCKMLAETK